MQSRAQTVEEYLAELPADRREIVEALRAVILANLPEGYEERMQYGMIGYAVPLARYPDTYNGQPLEVAAIGNQKHYVSLYLMAYYAERDARWLRSAWKAAGKKFDMGKSCVRIKKLDDVPLDVVAEAIARKPVAEFIAAYERSRG